MFRRTLSMGVPLSDAPTVYNGNQLLGMYDGTTSRETIFALEREILEHSQVEIPTTHDHCSGLYARTIRIPAGCVLTGAIHKDESFFIVRTGQILVTTDTGVAHVGPGFMAVTKPGQKRAGLALTDCEVVNIHANPTGETDQEKLWSMMTIEGGV